MTYRQGIFAGPAIGVSRSHADVNFAAHARVAELGTWCGLRCFPTGSHRYRVVSQENGEPAMNMPCKLLAAAALAAGTASFAAPAGAAPIAAPSSLHNAAAPALETVQWRRGWRGGGWAPAAVAGAIVGGAIAAAQPWNYGYYDGYAYAPGYGYDYAPGYAYGPAGYNDYAYAPGYTTGPAYSGGDSDAYCSQRFRSYDPSSGTYMGYDGRRHSCP